jgi:hypothetical protein
LAPVAVSNYSNDTNKAPAIIRFHIFILSPKTWAEIRDNSPLPHMPRDFMRLLAADLLSWAFLQGEIAQTITG